MPPVRIRDGFPNQTMIVVPRTVVASALRDLLPVALAATDAGLFTSAHNHYVERSKGAEETIFILCMRGAGWVRLGKQEHCVRPGQLAVLPPGQAHAYGATLKHPWSIFWCHVAGSAADKFGRQLLHPGDSPVLTMAEHLRLASLFEQLVDVLKQGYGPTQMIATSGVLAHLLALAVSLHRRIADSDAEDRIRQCARAMHQRPFGKVRMTELAEQCNLSASHFYCLFKRLTGYAPLDYFLRLKVQQACMLLATTDLPIKAVAAELGFADPLYFSRLFGRIQGMPASEYRRRMKWRPFVCHGDFKSRWGASSS